jgi:hypothetical protein
MNMPNDRESLHAAWEAIGPSNPLPDEIQDLLLAYFKNSQQHDNSEINGLLSPDDVFHSPPTRYVRQPRNNRSAPAGPVQSESCVMHITESWKPESPILSAACTSTGHQVEQCAAHHANGPDQLVNERPRGPL